MFFGLHSRSIARAMRSRLRPTSLLAQRRTAAITFVACTVGAATLISCNKSAPPPAPPVPVTISTAKAATGVKAGAYSANIAAETQVDVAFKVNGYVKSILQVKDTAGRLHLIQSGDPVKSGQVLATIRDDTYRQQTMRASSSLASARAQLAKNKADYERYSALLKQHVSSVADYDAAKQAFESSQAEVDSAAAALKQAQVDLDDCQLKAPISGLVLSRPIEVGTLVGPGTVGFQIGDTDEVKVVFGVAPLIVNQIKVGDPISITTDAFPGDKFDGSITKIAAAADPTSRIFDVEATIPNPHLQLKVGMIAGLHLKSGAAPPQELVVPMRALVRPPDNPAGYAVYVTDARDGKTYAKLTPVEIGDVTGDQVGIESGLAAGASVIVKGSDIVYNGQQVSVVP
jgi:RND family efflux transporter MFP subunit